MLAPLILAAAVAAAPASPPPSCRPAPLSWPWMALGGILGGLVGWAATSTEASPTFYVGTGIVLGATAGVAADRACRDPAAPAAPATKEAE